MRPIASDSARNIGDATSVTGTQWAHAMRPYIMLNYELFLKDPRSYQLPNDGVATVTEPTEKAQWDVLRLELESFICDGQYEKGIVTLLKSFLDTQGTGSVQSSAWISGFYGSGKSHLVRVLKFLWANAPLDDGTAPRDLANLPSEVSELLSELSNRGKSHGGLWSAVGLLGSGASSSPRLAFLSIILGAAKLPTDYSAAQFVLWLRQEGIESAVRDHLQAAGKTLEGVLPFLYISSSLREALRAARPDLGTLSEIGNLIAAQFPAKTDISDDELVGAIDIVLRGASSNGKMPLSLLVLDELEQYLGVDSARTLAVQNAIEACSKRFGGQLMIAATGQSALGVGAQIGKLQGRFALRVQLSDADVVRVVREVVLRKREEVKPGLQTEFNDVSGEISKQLVGSKISFRKDEDSNYLVADYPILPMRRRFWEEALRALDKQGGAAQLRNQLRAVHAANRAVANQSVGIVVGADALFNQERGPLLQNGILQSETDTLIADYEARNTARDTLLARILKITFLLNQMSADLGLPATEHLIADLLVEDLRHAAATRAQIAELIPTLTKSGQLLEVGGEFRVQTRESAGWNQDFNAARARYEGNSAQINTQRAGELNAALSRELKVGGALQILQGAAKEKRDIALFFSPGEPTPPSSGGAGGTAGWTSIPVWVRDGWNVTPKNFVDEATMAGADSPLIHVFLPNQSSEEIRVAIAGLLAADEVLQARGLPTTREGEEARTAMQSRLNRERATLDGLLKGVVKSADFRLSGGGTPAPGAGARATLLNAADVALKRLFPEWDKADHDRWGLILPKIREGNAAAFAGVNYNGDIEKHPVCAHVLSFVGSGRKGLEIVKHFKAAPYGWPQDAIHAALLALVQSQHLSATSGGSPRTVRQIETAQIGQTEFRRENITLTLPQKVEIRKFLTALGLPASGDNLPVQCQAVAPLLREAAFKAGGEAPAPLSPTLPLLAALEGNTGNALALEIYNERATLLPLWESWTAQAQNITARLPRFREWSALLDAEPDLPALAPALAARDAMKVNRSLLDDPDPITSYRNDTLATLRAALDAAHAEHEAARQIQIARLQASSLWQKLDESTQTTLLAAHGLNAVSAPPKADARAIGESLRAVSLGSWKTRAAALRAQADAALDAAAALMAPKSVKIALPSIHIESSDQIESYLDDLRARIETELTKGCSVVIS